MVRRRVWDTATGQCLRTLVHEDNAPVVSVRFSPNGKYVLAWTLDSCLRLWHYVDGRVVKTYQGHIDERYSIGGCFGTYNVEGQMTAFIASGSEDGKIVLWDVSSKEIVQVLEGHKGVVLGADTHESSSLLVTGGIDRTVRVWTQADEVSTPNEDPVRGGDLRANDGRIEGRHIGLQRDDTVENVAETIEES